MKIFRATKPEILKLIIPHLVEDGAYTREIIVKELLEMMMATPERICVATAFSGEELVGYTIGWIPNDRKYVWLGQSWCGPKCSRRNGKKAVELVKRWAVDEHNIHEIRFETERNGEALTRVWGFEIHGYIMNCTF